MDEEWVGWVSPLRGNALLVIGIAQSDARGRVLAAAATSRRKPGSPILTKASRCFLAYMNMIADATLRS